MSEDRRPASPIFTQVDISAGTKAPQVTGVDGDQSPVLREILSAQDRTNELLEELIGSMGATQKQRVSELNQWKEANPRLARTCRKAAEALSRVQVQYLENMTSEINDNAEDMVDGEFMLNEFVDRFGPRLAHLNGVLQVLAQLSSVPNPTSSNQQ